MKSMNQFFIILLVFTIVINTESQETHPIIWDKISLENATLITPAFKFQLETPIDLSNSSIYIDNLYIIPNTTHLFVSYKDRDTRQRFSPIWQIWDLQTGMLIFEQHDDISDSVLSSNGAYLGVLIEGGLSESDTICLWSLQILRPLACWESFYTSNLSFSPDDSLFLFNQKIDNAETTSVDLVIWDIQREQDFYNIDNIIGWKFNPSNSDVLMMYGQDINMWNISGTPQEIFNYQLNPSELIYGIFSNVTFDTSGAYLYFMTINFKDAKQQFNALSISNQVVNRLDRENLVLNLFQRPYADIFVFENENRLKADLVDGKSQSIIRTIDSQALLDINLNQDLLLLTSDDARMSSDTFLVQNLVTGEVYATLPYTLDKAYYQDVRFTQDERFILAYTQDGHVQLWGVPAEG